jgi:hypothetical protein
VRSFPKPLPGKQGLVRRLKDVPKFTVDNAAHIFVSELIEDPRQPVAETMHVIGHGMHYQSCPVALWAEHPAEVTEYCDFAVKRQLTELTYMPL